MRVFLLLQRNCVWYTDATKRRRLAMKHEKALFAVRIALSAVVILLAALQLLGVWENALQFAVPLLGVSLLLQSVTEWNTHRAAAVLGLCAAAFIFVCTAVVWFL